jgi:dTMP kinase
MSEISSKGLFIVIEGVDGAGTTTHTALLRKAFHANGTPAIATREPSDGPIGALIRQILKGRVVVPPGRHLDRGRPCGWKTMALLFAADRMDHAEAIVQPGLDEGLVVISDRYDMSSVAYQSITGLWDDEDREAVRGPRDVLGRPRPRDLGARVDWLRSINKNARRPDLTIVLDVNADETARRRRRRSDAAEIFDGDALQRALVEFYSCAEKWFPDERIQHIDASRSIEEVAADVFGIVSFVVSAMRPGQS